MTYIWREIDKERWREEEKERERERERDQSIVPYLTCYACNVCIKLNCIQWPVQTADVHCALRRSVTCLYLENRCVKVCKYMYVRLCSQSLQCLVLIIGAVYWIPDHPPGTSQDMSTVKHVYSNHTYNEMTFITKHLGIPGKHSIFLFMNFTLTA